MQEAWQETLNQQKFMISFSGGKDSSLALYHAKKRGQAVLGIMMLEETAQRSRSHAMPMSITHAQAHAMNLPIIHAASTWNDYESQFLALLAQGKQAGASVLVTGDLDVPNRDAWHEKIAKKAGLDLCMPLLNRCHQSIAHELIALGFVAIVVSVNLSLGMRLTDLGRVLDLEYIQELTARGIDVCGEGGEFHTTILDGPIFNQAIAVKKGEVVQHGDYGFLSLTLDSEYREA